MAALSSNLLLSAFFIYLFATITFAISITGKKFTSELRKDHQKRWGRLGFILALVGFVAHLGYFITRWIAAGHAPVSNLFEFVTFFALALVLGYIIIFLIYRNHMLGIIAMPVALIIIAYASVFPSEITPLIPALKSYWLTIHVITVALGEGILAISFVTGLLYLLKSVDQTKRTKRNTSLELVLFSLLMTVGFILAGSIFPKTVEQTTFEWVNERNVPAELVYDMPAIVGPFEGTKLTENSFGPLFEAPYWMNGAEAPRKLNTVIWSFLIGLLLYGTLRLILRKRIGAAIQPLVSGVNAKLMDEIGYRSVAIGFPVFALGGLIFASIWAQVAWSRFWGWDPKEVWALITFLFYAIYLHLRLSRGWEGENSAWLAVAGFIIIMFNLIAVNLILAGLHTYA
ncbi:c-type cytochrome biogenesis protein CcsB [Lottiidibacillus patelloidae]|uniref:C-type cytochrome biogenesis protein CcsB n=1 Tax=Lottiidibacillus patelloidae TaxID=2670334 RepID=A0A263BUB6_9BACI|nr:c-type cytochrome biogenesis protein CcsB [Lottiidibacillus patelloidae]OZM57158.1 c-type cytochrome biogenesis protein CcsB [Lottiidibacillus patelloidae]